MKKTWGCLICKRDGNQGTTLSAAKVEHDSQQKNDARVNEYMKNTQGPSFAGPMTNCAGNIRLAVVPAKPSGPAPQSGTLGGDEPWI